jgi:hypothetical protein
MTPLLQLLKLMFTSDSRYKQRAIIDFLAAVKETMEKIHKRLSSVYGNSAVDRKTRGR